MPVNDKSVELFLADKEKKPKKSGDGPGTLSLIITLIVIGGLGYGAVKLYGTFKGWQIEEENRIKAEAEASRAAREAEAQKIADAKREQIKNADKDTLGKVVSSCKDQIYALRKDSPFAIHFPYYSPDNLERFAGIGMPSGGFPSAVLDNYDFNAVNWNIDRIRESTFPTISFVVEGADDGFSVRQFAAVYSCRLDGLNATEPQRTSVHYLN